MRLVSNMLAELLPIPNASTALAARQRADQQHVQLRIKIQRPDETLLTTVHPPTQ